MSRWRVFAAPQTVPRTHVTADGGGAPRDYTPKGTGVQEIFAEGKCYHTTSRALLCDGVCDCAVGSSISVVPRYRPNCALGPIDKPSIFCYNVLYQYRGHARYTL
jgi:hypothetical protein